MTQIGLRQDDCAIDGDSTGSRIGIVSIRAIYCDVRSRHLDTEVQSHDERKVRVDNTMDREGNRWPWNQPVSGSEWSESSPVFRRLINKYSISLFGHGRSPVHAGTVGEFPLKESYRTVAASHAPFPDVLVISPASSIASRSSSRSRGNGTIPATA